MQERLKIQDREERNEWGDVLAEAGGHIYICTM